MNYKPPVKDMAFTLYDVLGFENPEIDRETADAIFDEASKLASDVLAPLNVVGDEHGAKREGAEVTMPPGFKEAYAQYRDGGWNAVPFNPEYGGQGLPYAIAFPVQEMWQGANMGFGLCPLLNQGAVEAIEKHGTQAQKDYFLEKLITGQWTGTMNLTEPQAGSDLALLKAKAERNEDGSYRISGEKIWITYGEHDLSDNIIHLVLARLPDAPAGVKGISLFIVPKILEDGSRNTLECTKVEHKLGIHGSATCSMLYTEAKGALLGEEHDGLKCMFTMMNNARLSVGLQGVAIAERAMQHALAYAADRPQGNDLETGEGVMIERHPDVQRMILTMKSLVHAGRLLTYDAALALDAAHDGDAYAKAKVDIMTPLVKGWCTELAQEVASLGVQIHGGMGFIEETGAAQYFRDARILPIYEGTNGIQANDLVFRKTARDGGQAVMHYIDALKDALPESEQATFAGPFQALEQTVSIICEEAGQGQLKDVAWRSSPFMKGFATIAGGVMLARAAQAAQALSDQEMASDYQHSAAFYMQAILPRALAELSIAQAARIEIGAAPSN